MDPNIDGNKRATNTKMAASNSLKPTRTSYGPRESKPGWKSSPVLDV
jgi:hypothetical protein